jgi:hypothetical protein
MQTRPLTQDHEPREYVLTDKGRELQPVIITLTEWGDRCAAPDGPPVIYDHPGCGGRVHVHLGCDNCDTVPGPGLVTTRPGPGARPGQI